MGLNIENERTMERRARIDSLLEELDQSLAERQKQEIRDAQDQLYDDRGLPL